jgi:hypothetical protein
MKSYIGLLIDQVFDPLYIILGQRVLAATEVRSCVYIAFLFIPFDEPVDCSMINREIPCYFVGVMSSEVIFNEQLSCFIV